MEAQYGVEQVLDVVLVLDLYPLPLALPLPESVREQLEASAERDDAGRSVHLSRGMGEQPVYRPPEADIEACCQSASKFDPLSAFNIDPLAAISGGSGRPAKRVRVAQPGGCGGVTLRPRRGS